MKVRNFKNKLNDLCDIAHSNALELIADEEGKKFLMNQRKKGRVGSIGSEIRRPAGPDSNTTSNVDQMAEFQSVESTSSRSLTSDCLGSGSKLF